MTTDDQHTEADRARVQAAVADWISRAREITGASARRLPVPEVRFDLRGRSAGQAVYAKRSRRCHIRINTELLAAYPSDMLAVTVPHEVAHVAIYRLYGMRAKPHGAEWKSLMAAFGVDASACHNMTTTPTRRLARFRYRCGCAEPAWLTSIRHKRVLAGTRYCCRRCHQTLVADTGESLSG
ncbi:SprT-like domain-containing protein [uncultured Salinisphaera sp.]|uniref:SprT family zinc-dependent metalloprotease n=1 Tax=uncultured Salinisphaera sp. TaxID=359372 RepID=UPI0032B12D5D|tara:strand:- start:5408 stop:5953 length:546 start_codon:yes stop_codon:yes gene_type:complete